MAPETTVRNEVELLYAIGACIPDSENQNFHAVTIVLWDYRVVVANYYECSELEVDVKTSDFIFTDCKPLIPFVDNLLKNENSFVTETGTHNMTCTLKWSIKPKKL